jgi:hypothetical protein
MALFPMKTDNPATFELLKAGQVKFGDVKRKAGKGGESARPECGPASEPETPRKIGQGVQLANEAINMLARIPKGDALRERGFEMVVDWIRRARASTSQEDA